MSSDRRAEAAEREAKAQAARRRARAYLSANNLDPTYATSTRLPGDEKARLDDNTLELRTHAREPSRGRPTPSRPSERRVGAVKREVPSGFTVVRLPPPEELSSTTSKREAFLHGATGAFDLIPPNRPVKRRGHFVHRDEVGLPRGWKVLVVPSDDDSSKKKIQSPEIVYYWNVLTGETTRCRPQLNLGEIPVVSAPGVESSVRVAISTSTLGGMKKRKKRRVL